MQSNPSHIENKNLPLAVVLLFVIASLLAGCGPGSPPPEELAAVDYTPLPGSEFEISTPAEQGMDPLLVAEMYYRAADMDQVYGLLVFKNDNLIAEKYFHGGSVDQQLNIHSVTKSYTSALVGIALEQGCISGLDQKMVDFFPELIDQIRDPRKLQITLRDMLQMRAGYPWEESSAELFELLYAGFRPSNLVDVPLVRDPGSDFDYSNLTSHLIGVIVARACDMDLKSFAEKYLFEPLGVEVSFWQVDWEGNFLGHSDIQFAARDLAKFGLLYLNDGMYQGNQIVPADWVHDSLQVYSEDAWKFGVGRNWQDNGYGYQWWSVRAGDYRYNLAWGHGGQQIAVLKDLDMVIVLTVDPLHGQHGDGPWSQEKENLNLVADFVASLP